MIKEPVDVLASDNVADVRPSNVDPCEERKARDMGVERLQGCQHVKDETGKGTYFLTLDAGEEEDLNESNASADQILVENEEGCEPAVSEGVVTWKG